MDLADYSLVLNETDHQPIIENNQILLVKNTDETCEYMPLTKGIIRHFDLSELSGNVEDNVLDMLNTEDSKKFTWTQQNTLLFLDEYKSRFSRFRDPKVKKKIIWEEIAQEMNKKSYHVDADTLDRKMRNMKHTYRVICDNNNNKKKTTGAGRINWEYYNYFVDMFQNDKTINLPSTILSSTITEESSRADTELFANISIHDITTPCSTSLTSQSSTAITNHQVSASLVEKTANTRLDKYRKRQLEIEKGKLEELKKIRLEISESNALQKEKLELMKLLVQPTNTKTV